MDCQYEEVNLAEGIWSEVSLFAIVSRIATPSTREGYASVIYKPDQQVWRIRSRGLLGRQSSEA